MKRIVLILVAMIFVILSSTLVTAGDFRTIAEWSGTITGRAPFAPPAGTCIYTKSEIEEKWPNSILFSLELFTAFPIIGKEFATSEYYMVGEKIIGLGYHLEVLDNSTEVSNVIFTVTAPNGVEYCNISLPTMNNTVIAQALGNDSFTLDMEGLWNFRTEFITNNNETLIWKDIGNGLYQTFQPSAEQDGTTHLSFYSFYNEGIPVLKGSDVLQVAHIAYIAQQTTYLNKSAAAQQESMKAQKNLAYATIILAAAAAVSAIASFFSISASKSRQKSLERSFNELIKVLKEQSEVLKNQGEISQKRKKNKS